MAKGTLKYFKIGFEYDGPGDLLGDAIDGTLRTVSKKKIVVTGNEGGKLVFKGDFEISNGVVTNGTITGFTAFVGQTKVMKGTGYKIPFANLATALGNEEALVLLLSNKKTVGTNGDDLIFAASKTILGRGGDDAIFSGFGDKVIKGGNGNDLIGGGIGHDVLFGGKGRDVFAFDTLLDGIDKLPDFNAKKDKIAFHDSNDFAFLGPTIEATEFVIGKAASTAEQHIIYDDKSGKLYVDKDGASGDGQILLAKLPKGLNLTAGNFYVDDFF